MYTFLLTPEFDKWLKKLRDPIGKARIIARIRSAEAGNFGDCEPVGKGVSEMRVHYGPGYRVYHVRNGETIYLLLCGGSKSTQKKDIKNAHDLAERYREHAND
ncbi:putative addiction module killer protein [Ectothiorhodosinus mongolicus]|uniref:Putative addiction module killer protein n=1 Tax=Ectothiorhodosinus mongolicus TaxID=233100 RepID=A0A1R3W191_9GAMM|nr:type II toxin-antitoxin system RelE/ParE family toxin [Ectothiorhodosinus mongolicus]ULX57392.1 addiction module protein [Ectothiorhodosinus mongolicus]SIT71353.1 putative addiction module killer protein [Ectothiorhodosinus mongolicus]